MPIFDGGSSTSALRTIDDSRQKVRLPCAIGVLNGDSFLQRSTSTWIHWKSPDASANVLIISWVTVIHLPTATSLPIHVLSSSTVPITSLSDIPTLLAISADYARVSRRSIP